MGQNKVKVVVPLGVFRFKWHAQQNFLESAHSCSLSSPLTSLILCFLSHFLFQILSPSLFHPRKQRRNKEGKKRKKKKHTARRACSPPEKTSPEPLVLAGLALPLLLSSCSSLVLENSRHHHASQSPCPNADEPRNRENGSREAI